MAAFTVRGRLVALRGNNASLSLRTTSKPTRGRLATRILAQAPPGDASAALSFPDDGSTQLGAPSQPAIPAAKPVAGVVEGDQLPGAQGGEAAGAPSPVVLSPANPLTAALRQYDDWLTRYPVITKAATSCIGFAIGDRLAQGIGAGLYDPWRGVRLSMYGLLIDGPVGHAWYKLLDKHIEPDNPRGTKAVLIKTLLDQTIWALPMTCVFFALLRTLEGHPELILPTIQDKLWRVYAGNLMVWPLAHLINFRYVPTDYRILFNNTVSILWNCWLSWSCAGPGGHPSGPGSLTSGAASMADLPCHKSASVVEALHLGDAMRQLAGMERLLAAWGVQALPNAEMAGGLLEYYAGLKLEVAEKLCGIPTHSVPPKF
eukprot:scaffold20.g7656.t1